MTPYQQQIVMEGKGIVGSIVTASSASITWIEQANAIVDLLAGIVAILAGTCTVAWYICRFYRLRGGANDKTNSR